MNVTLHREIAQVLFNAIQYFPYTMVTQRVERRSSGINFSSSPIELFEKVFIEN